MSPLAFYRDLIAHGVPDEAAYEMASRFEADREAEAKAREAELLSRLSVDLKAEARRAKDRARKAAKPGIPRNSADSAESAETIPSPKNLSEPSFNSESNQTPTLPKTPLTGVKKVSALGARLPDGWRPDAAGWAYAAETLGPNVSPANELDRFLDYWRAVPGAKGRKLDWPATWRNWCRTAAERTPSFRKAHDRPHEDPRQAARSESLRSHHAGAMAALNRRLGPVG